MPLPKGQIARNNVVIEKTTPLTKKEKALFAYFGEGVKVLPPLRFLNPQNIIVRDHTSVREGCNFNAFRDLSHLHRYVDEKYQRDIDADRYRYEPQIEIGRACQIGRFFFLSCTKSVIFEDQVILSERVFVGDNNHTSAHEHVPIMLQPNSPGEPVRIGSGSWLGVGAAILEGAQLGKNTVVGANAVVRRGSYPDRAVIATPSAAVVQRSKR